MVKTLPKVRLGKKVVSHTIRTLDVDGCSFPLEDIMEVLYTIHFFSDRNPVKIDSELRKVLSRYNIVISIGDALCMKGKRFKRFYDRMDVLYERDNHKGQRLRT